MDMWEYQVQAYKTAIYAKEYRIIYPALGLAGEVGEVLNKVKKVLRDANGILTDEARKEIAGEISDSLWYLAALSTDLGISLNDLADANLAKLASRKERGRLQGSGDNR
jgi:NTP pyrophosphatase (non-canonical NTP hydrolase)